MPDETPPSLGYAGLAIDRMAERRDDDVFVEAEAARPDARTVVASGDRPVLKAVAGGALDPLLAPEDLAAVPGAKRVAYLGRLDEAPLFAALVGEAAGEALARSDDLVVEDLRALAMGGRLKGPALSLVGYAKAMAHWHGRHRFCSNCGSETAPNASGWRRACPNCGMLHFPRVDPVVIVLVTRGTRCLLGRQSRFPPGMWSCLAGFVEPGETIEDAARREIGEEAGVRLGSVTYELSQPWPFPSQLMVGLSAESHDETVTPDLSELEDARWFTRDELALMLKREHPDGLFAPHPTAIAHQLIRRFMAR